MQAQTAEGQHVFRLISLILILPENLLLVSDLVYFWPLTILFTVAELWSSAVLCILFWTTVNAGEVFLIDANSTVTYQKGHLPGARTLTNKKKLERELPVLKNYPIAVYCGGPQCTS